LTSREELIERTFVSTAVGFLNKLNADGAINDLVLIADPKTLGEIRKRLGQNLQHKILAEIAKDLVKHPVADIQSVISDN
jgi:protein required for attachment to host cells